LWDREPQKEAKLLEALDELRQRFGKDIIQRADALQRTRPESSPSETKQ